MTTWMSEIDEMSSVLLCHTKTVPTQCCCRRDFQSWTVFM